MWFVLIKLDCLYIFYLNEIAPHNKYKSNESSSYIQKDEMYKDQLITGFISQDTVTVAGLVLDEQLFAEANQTFRGFANLPYDVIKMAMFFYLVEHFS